MKKKVLLAIATGWGSRHGGINSFNFDFLRGFAAAFVEVKVVCLVPQMSFAEQEQARQFGIDLRSLVFRCESEQLDESAAQSIVGDSCRDLAGQEIICVGHDVFTGALTIALAKLLNAKSVVIHHMSYDTYKGYESGSSEKARQKTKLQREIFLKAEVRLAVGPLLRDELNDWYGEGACQMLIPGLPEIEPSNVPSKWTTILFGRLNPATNRIKQTKLGIIAAAKCEQEARSNPGLAKKLQEGTRIRMYGADEGEEASLRSFVEAEIGAVIDLHVLPYTEDRSELFEELRRASLALMPSWHEGFGLVGWEAIAAGVPVILGRDSGLYRFLNEFHPGDGTGCVTTINVRGSQQEPHYQTSDVDDLVSAIKRLAADENVSKRKALTLRRILNEYTPKRLAEDFATYVGWGELVRDDLAITPIPPALGSALYQIDVLQIPTPTWQASRGQSYSQLLRAEEACVPYHVGKEDQLAQLVEWANASTYPLMLRLFTGAGGTGKTRLLIEACNRLSDEVWKAGFLTSELTLAELERRFTAELPSKDKWFIVVDYAETRRDQVAALVELAQRFASVTIKIVMLARDAGEWWERLAADYPKCEKVFAGAATSPPQSIQRLLPSLTDRIAGYQEAIRAYGDRLGFANIDNYIDSFPELEAEHFSRPLYLQMAALLALHGERADSPNGLTDGILRHEFRYWKGIALSERSEDGARLIGQLMASATLTGGLQTERDAWDTLSRAGILLPPRAEIARLFRALCPLYPGRQGLQPLQPDLLGEALIASLITSQGSEAQIDCVLAGPTTTAQREHALTVLTRTVRLRPGLTDQLRDALTRNFNQVWRQAIKVGRESGAPLSAITCSAFLALRDQVKMQVADPVLCELESSSLQWDPLTLLASDVRVAHTKMKFDRAVGRKRDDARRDFARSLRNRSVAKSYLADYDGSLIDAISSMKQFEQCTLSNDTQLTEFALSINNVSNRASALGNYPEAFDHSTRAVALLDEITARDPKHYVEHYATVLANLGTCHGYLFRYELAYEYTKRASDLLEPLILADLHKHADEYGLIIDNLSIYAGDLGRSEESMELALKAIELHRPLCLEHPDRYTGEYATALLNLGVNYSIAEDFFNAVKSNDKAAAFLKPIAASRPEKYAGTYGLVLYNSSEYQGHLGNYEEALRLAEESSVIFSSLVEKYPAIYQERHLASLGRIAIVHADIGDFSAALDYWEIALAHLKKGSKLSRRKRAEKMAEILVAISFHGWLLCNAVDLAFLEAEIQALSVDATSYLTVQTECQLQLLAACAATATSTSLTEEKFGALVAKIEQARSKDRAEMAGLYVIGAQYLSELQPSVQAEAKTILAWTVLRKRCATRIPAWISETLIRLKLNNGFRTMSAQLG
jgi:glycosyltransferase involved in cell wall biosynthesis